MHPRDWHVSVYRFICVSPRNILQLTPLMLPNLLPRARQKEGSYRGGGQYFQRVTFYCAFPALSTYFWRVRVLSISPQLSVFTRICRLHCYCILQKVQNQLSFPRSTWELRGVSVHHLIRYFTYGSTYTHTYTRTFESISSLLHINCAINHKADSTMNVRI